LRARPSVTETGHGAKTTAVGRLFGRLAAVALACVGLAVAPLTASAQMIPEGASTIQAPPGQSGAANDPLEGFNRKMFSFNLFLAHKLLEPTARAYRWAVPKPGRRSVTNFLNNLDTPVLFANDVLQGDMNEAGVTTARFLSNSTIGVGGLFDPAKGWWGLDRRNEDFGQTLGVWGVGSGPYLMLPLLGPSNPRDLTGRAVDQAFDPLTWTGGRAVTYVQLGLLATRTVTKEEAVMDEFNQIERTSIDFYSQVRSIYNQQRASAIRNGRADTSDLPDLAEFDINQ
jgi:phospholipid-binding lipoprotein MlaA